MKLWLKVLQRGDRVRITYSKKEATILAFVDGGFLVQRDDGTRWIYPYAYTEHVESA